MSFAFWRLRSNAHVLICQAYREGSYDVAFDLYNQLLDTAEPVSNYHPHLCLSHCLQELRRTLRYSYKPSSIPKPSRFYQHWFSSGSRLASNVYYIYSGDCPASASTLDGCAPNLRSHDSKRVYGLKLQTSTEEGPYVACTGRGYTRGHSRPRSGAMVEEKWTFNIWTREEKKGTFRRWRRNTRECICWHSSFSDKSSFQDRRREGQKEKINLLWW